MKKQNFPSVKIEKLSKKKYTDLLEIAPDKITKNKDGSIVFVVEGSDDPELKKAIKREIGKNKMLIICLPKSVDT